MANQLKMAEIHSILRLRTRGWSFRRIARELGVHRETVARYVQLAAAPAKPANAPIGSGIAPGIPDALADPVVPILAHALIGSAGPEPAKAPIGSDGMAGPPSGPIWTGLLPPPGCAGRPSGSAPYRAIIEAKLAAGLSAVRIHQDLVAELGVTLSYHAVRRFLSTLRAATPPPFRRMECAPGEEAQVDFGRGAPVAVPAAPGSKGSKLRYRRPHAAWRLAGSEAPSSGRF